MKKFMGIIFPTIFLLYFGTIFALVIFVGNRANYYELHKLQTLLPNPVLLTLALFLLIPAYFLWHFLSRLPEKKALTACWILGAGLLCIAMYFLNLQMSMDLSFKGGWDVGAVEEYAKTLSRGESIQDDYLTTATNQIPLVWLQYELYRLALRIPEYPYAPEFIWVQFQCIQFSLTAFLIPLTVYQLRKKDADAILSLLLSLVFFTLSPWKFVAYTDGSTVLFPVLAFFLYLCSKKCSGPVRYLLYAAGLLSAVVGGVLKPTVYLILIAILMADLLQAILGAGPGRVRHLLFCIVLLLLSLGLAKGFRRYTEKITGYVPQPNLAITWSTYLPMALDEESTGTCNGIQYDLARSHPEMTPAQRRELEFSLFADALKERGLKGTLSFYLRKSILNYNDGTFSWYTEGTFHYRDYEPSLPASRYRDLLRQTYWTDDRVAKNGVPYPRGQYYLRFTTLCQGLWIFLLVGILLHGLRLFLRMARYKKEELQTSDHSGEICLLLCLLGISFFLLLFEGRARYLFNFTPLYLVSCTMGIGWLFNTLSRYFKTHRAGRTPQ